MPKPTEWELVLAHRAATSPRSPAARIAATALPDVAARIEAKFGNRSDIKDFVLDDAIESELDASPHLRAPPSATRDERKTPTRAELQKMSPRARLDFANGVQDATEKLLGRKS